MEAEKPTSIPRESFGHLMLDKQRTVDYLAGLKTALHEKSKNRAEIIDAGMLVDVVPGVSFDGSIGVDARLEANEITNEDLVAHSEKSSICYVPVQTDASVRCVDGRKKKGYDDNSVRLFTESLGPQLVAGTAGTAFALGITQRSLGLVNNSYLEDYTKAANIDRSLGFKPGNHTGQHCKSDTIDCGGYDGRFKTLYKIAEDTEATKKIVMTFYEALEMDFAPQIFNKVAAGAKSIRQDPDYFPGLNEFREKILSENPKGLEEKDLEHREIDFIENMDKGSTLQTSHLNALTNDKTQSFSDDGWYRESISNVLLEHNQENKIFIMAHVAHTLCTARNITNGHINFKIRLPK